MKKILFPVLLFLGFVLIFSSCKKDNPTDNNNTTTLRYEFTSDMDGHYNLTYAADTIVNNEEINARTWSKTVVVTKNSVNMATLTVYPPVEWQGTTVKANVTAKIFVNGEQKASATGVFTGIDRPTGLTTSTTVQ